MYVKIGFDVLFRCTFLSNFFPWSFSGLGDNYVCSTAIVRTEALSNIVSWTSPFGSLIYQHWDNEIVAILNHSGLPGFIIYMAILIGFTRYMYLCMPSQITTYFTISFLLVFVSTRELFTSLYSFSGIYLLLLLLRLKSFSRNSY